MHSLLPVAFIVDFTYLIINFSPQYRRLSQGVFFDVGNVPTTCIGVGELAKNPQQLPLLRGGEYTVRTASHLRTDCPVPRSA